MAANNSNLSIERRRIALERAQEMKAKIEGYLQARDDIPRGLELESHFQNKKRLILEVLGGTEKEWDDWHWQMEKRIDSVETLEQILDLKPGEKEEIAAVEGCSRWAISPYYASLMSRDDACCPVRMMGVPTMQELEDTCGTEDPMAEDFTNPAGSITRRYPDRLIINITNVCAMFCRHCQRRRNIDEVDKHHPREVIEASLSYIRQHQEIRDVLITGGDPLTLTNQQLEPILRELKAIPHVEYIRIGTRTPVTMPQRITDQLCSMLARYHPLYINLQFNHPREITTISQQACEKLSRAGIPLGNQAVLLNGINNDRHVMKLLNHELLKIRVRPYYIFHAKAVEGTTHFRTSIDDGIEIMEYLRGYTSGMAIPTFIVNAPRGLGKTPIMPEYILSRGKGYVMIRNWEGKVLKYENSDTEDIDQDRSLA